jgi:hypothetical protein
MSDVKRGRRTNQFFITLGGLEYYEDIRRDFYNYFDDIEEYCESTEKNHVNKFVHVHAYIKFYNLKTLSEVRDVLSLYDGTLNVKCEIT